MFAHSPLRLLLRGTTLLPFAHSVLTRALVSFPLADIGEGIRDVEITKWLVKEGDYVNEFDPICEVRSDKATAEITSRYTGFIAKVYNPHEGSTQLVGSPLVDIQTTTDTDQQACGNTSEDSARQSYSSMEKEEKSPHTKGTKEMCLSPAVRFLVKEHQLDVSNLTGTGRHGRITKEDLIQFLGRASQTRTRTPCEASTLHPVHSVGNPKPVQKTAPAAAACIPSSDRNTLAPQQRVIQPLRGIRRAMARTMTLAASVPTFSCSEEIDVSELLKLRRRLQPIAEKEMATARNQRIHLTLTPFFLKAVSLSMKHFPLINARYISEDEVHIMTRHDIGFALDSPDGLLVPKVRDCENRSILDIAAEVTALTTAGRDGKLRRETLIDGTVTLSNIGTIGATYTTPTLLHPEVAIGAVGRIQQLPRFDLETLKSRYDENSSSTVSMDCVRVAHVMHTSWTADHRVIDGATMVRFLKKFKSYLEQPALMVLDLR